MHADLLSTARKLLCPIDGNEPSNTDLRRAVSTAYYAVFHHLSRACSELLVKSEDKLLTRAQSQVYRAIDHRDVMAACQMARNAKTGFPKSISDYASLIVNMYRSRCNADYDPSEAGNFSIPQVLHKIGEVEEAIRRFNSVNADDRLAFALLVVVKKARRDQM